MTSELFHTLARGHFEVCHFPWSARDGQFRAASSTCFFLGWDQSESAPPQPSVWDELVRSVSRETNRRTMLKLPAFPHIREWCFLSGSGVSEDLCCEIFESALFCSDIPFPWHLKSTEPLYRNTIRSDSVVTIRPLEQPGRWGDSRPSWIIRAQSSTAALFHVKRSQSAAGTRGDSTDAASPPRWSTGTPCMVPNRRRARIHLMITPFYLQSLTRRSRGI